MRFHVQMRISFSPCVPVVIVLLASYCAPSFGQGYGISASSQVTAGLSAELLGGVLYNPSCNVTNPGVSALPETSYTLTPLSCGGTYEAIDQTEGAFYSETSIGHVTSVWIDKGMSYVSLSDSGGIADPNLLNNIGGYAEASAVWTDTLTVTGLPLGTPVMLRVTDYSFGSLQLTNTQNSPLTEFVALEPANGSPAILSGCSTAVAINNDYYTSTPIINSRQYVDLCTTSGSILALGKEIQSFLVAGGVSSWTAQANLNDQMFVDSLTPGASFTAASGTDYTTPGGTVPRSSTGCNGTFSGAYTGDIKVSSGQTCVFTTGNISGHVTESGGQLILTNTAVGGNVTITGGTFMLGPFTTIGGNLKVNGVPESTETNDVCNTTVTGDMELENVGATLEIGSSSPTCAGDSIGGHLLVKDNTGQINIFDNFVTDNLHVKSDTGSTQVYNNNVGKNLLLQIDSGSTAVFNNTVVDDLKCEANSTLSGGGNTAKKKEGQCASF